jgi:hypothetical protein
MTFKSFLQGGRRSGRAQQQSRESLLRFTREPNDLDFRDSLYRGFLGGGNDKTTD